MDGSKKLEMMKKLFLPILIITFTFTFSFILNKNTYAKPVKVEEFLTYKNSWQLDLGISYSNIEKS